MSNHGYISDNESIISETNSEIINNIYQEEIDFLDSDKIDNNYYIGNYLYINKDNLLLLSSSISPKTFFKYSSNEIIEYLYSFSIGYTSLYNIQIMKLCISKNNIYTVILKTFWINLIKRHFKKIFIEKKKIIKKRKNLKIMEYNQIHGRYPYGLNNYPSLRGMLAEYSK